MNWTEQEAEAAVGKMFPGCRAYVADGCEQHVSGVVEEADGKTIASFRLYYKNYLLTDEINPIRQIRIGDVGEFCGTADELQSFREKHPELSEEDDADAPVIKVDMEVSRCRHFPEDDNVDIWGYVGDYEVRVGLPSNDSRVRSILDLDDADTVSAT